MNFQEKLEAELRRLQETFRVGWNLKVRWLPCEDKPKSPLGNNPLSGQIVGNTIYIYEKEESQALDTLIHEFFDWLVSTRIEKPYKQLINKLIEFFEGQMYLEKEKLVESFVSAWRGGLGSGSLASPCLLCKNKNRGVKNGGN